MQHVGIALSEEVVEELKDLAAINNCSLATMVERLVKATEGGSLLIPTSVETAKAFHHLANLEASGDPNELPTTILFKRLVRWAAHNRQIARLRSGEPLDPALPPPTQP